jgi:hypothetical protein
MLNTLGEVVTCAIALIAVLVVPAAIIRAWFPVIRAHIADMLMSRSGGVRSYPLSPSDRRFTAVSSAERNSETGETAPAPAEIEREKIHFAENAVAEALARLVISEELDLTKAVKIGAGKKSGEGYQKWSRLVKAAIERLKEPEFPALAAQQRQSIVEKS